MNDLYKLVTIENVDLSYEEFDKKELIQCILNLRATYFRLKKENAEVEQLKEEIRKYQKDRDINTKRHLEVQDYIKSRIQYCKEITGFDCCIEELQEISKMV